MNQKICNAASTGIGLGQYTLAQLRKARDAAGNPALHWAACWGHLDQIPGGVTARQLAAVRSEDGNTALHIAAGFGNLDQVKGGVTAADLMAAELGEGHTALHRAALHSHLNQIQGGVTFHQLAGAPDCGWTALHFAARSGSLHHVAGGVTTRQILDAGLDSVLEQALIHGHLDQIKGGVTFQQLSSILGPPFPSLLHQLQHQIRLTHRRRIAELENSLVGCPEAVALLDLQDDQNHVQALHGAVKRNPARLGPFLTPEMTAALL